MSVLETTRRTSTTPIRDNDSEQQRHELEEATTAAPNNGSETVLQRGHPTMKVENNSHKKTEKKGWTTAQ
jgi:hypothetical protein